MLDSMKMSEEQMSEDEMDESLKVYQYLKGWKYLVVIDDVWGTQFWDDVRFMFPDDNNGSRIVLTTRLLDVAVYLYSAGPVHKMQFMNDSQSWELLKLKVFGNGNCPSGLEEVGKEIARRCAGLPLALAVVLVAGVLSQENKTRASWENIGKNVSPIVGREIEEILSLSYNYLPHHLRPCFLFIGGFLEDTIIQTSRLIRLWVADGFVKRKNGCSKSSEEEAEEYLEDLAKRNLVIVTSRKSDGKIKNCSLHDMVRSLCIRNAHQEKFLRVMDGHDLPHGLMNERHISFRHSDIADILGPTCRTILCFRTRSFPSLLGGYILLRVLDALGVKLKELPSELFDLYYLRYLGFKGSLAFSIPSAISNLVNLQTLIIQPASGKYDYALSQSLPSEIWRMPQLRHLFVSAPHTLPNPPEGLNTPLQHLQTLLFVENLVWNEEIVQLIPNVKRLGLTYTKINQECDLHHLKDMHHLEKLEVIGYMGFSWRGQSRPSFPCTLKKLTLVNVGLPWRDMAVVGQLPNLETLKLLRHACNGQTWETNDEDFPRLRFLLIGDSHLQQWITQSKPFPTLKCLVLRSCESLVEFPEAIGEIPTLELIDLYCCANSLVASAMKIKEDQESYGNCALQVRAYSYFEGSSSTELSSNASSDYSPRQHKVPSHFLCPISQEVMEDPHVAGDGHTYEADAIREWFNSGHKTSPVTKLELENFSLVPNTLLRSAILEWLQNA